MVQIIQAGFEIKNATHNLEQTIEEMGRICYKSEDRITNDSATGFIKRLLDSQHESVLEHGAISVKLTVDRGITHELVRHRLTSPSQESTRYCNYSKGKFGAEITVIDLATGFKMDLTDPKDMAIYKEWLEAMADAERHYMNMVSKGANAQMARSVLPNSLKAEIGITANPREWRWVFKKRADAAAHPQAREVMEPMLVEFKRRWPALFGDL